MNRKRWALPAAVLLLAVASYFLFSRYTLAGFRFYPRNVQILDLRDQALPPDDYEKLHTRLPDTQILWNVPFQGSLLPHDTEEVTVSTLTAEEADLLALCLPQLRVLHAEECRDYEALLSLKQQRPEVQVDYRVPVNGTNYASTSVWLTLDGFEEPDLALLPYLPRLNTITITGGQPQALLQLQDYCRDTGIALKIQLGDRFLSPYARAVEVTGITNDGLSLLYLLPELTRIHLPEPEADVQAMLDLEAYTGATLTWEKTILGMNYAGDAQVIDLTPVLALASHQLPGALTAYQIGLNYVVQHTDEEVRSAVKVLEGHPLPNKAADTAALIAEAEAAMAYFPQAHTLRMTGCYLDNEAMARFRERHREEYKVAWTVDCGKIAPRTDATFFMPVKYHVYYLSTAEAYNLRYCEDLVALDIGHMNLSDIRFVEFMPNLQYLILAHTSVQFIDSLKTCKNLKFLELDHTAVRDLTPLLECTALEDLNIGETWCDVAPLTRMTWLKNLWMIDRHQSAFLLSEFLPDTHIVSRGTATVDSGWRDLPNYYAMRDELKMFYMSW